MSDFPVPEIFNSLTPNSYSASPGRRRLEAGGASPGQPPPPSPPEGRNFWDRQTVHPLPSCCSEPQRENFRDFPSSASVPTVATGVTDEVGLGAAGARPRGGGGARGRLRSCAPRPTHRRAGRWGCGAGPRGRCTRRPAGQAVSDAAAAAAPAAAAGTGRLRRDRGRGSPPERLRGGKVSVPRGQRPAGTSGAVVTEEKGAKQPGLDRGPRREARRGLGTSGSRAV